MFESYLWFRRGGGGLEAGAKTWFYADSAPDGWTIDATVADALLALKGGSQAYNVDGGNLAGTWTQPNHTLTEAEIPAHDHGSAGAHTHTAYRQYAYVSAGSPANVGSGASVGTVSESSATTTDTVDSDGAHTHTSVGGSGAHNHGATYRPYACLGIVCSKDGSSVDLPAGTKTWLYVNSAPSGWTADATPSDRVIAVKGGSNAYNASGATMAGTWTQPGHVLTASEIPAHTHGEAGAHTHTIDRFHDAGTQYTVAGVFDSYYTSASGIDTSSNGAHTHSSVGSGTAHSHGTAYRPLARVGLICSKDDAGSFIAGDSTYFYQNAAPLLWTAESFTDALLGVKGGSTYTTGAAEAGSWTQPDCTLEAANLPAHTHGEGGAHTHAVPNSNQYPRSGSDWKLYAYNSTKTSSSNGAHTHDSVGSGDAHNHGTTYRPYAAVGIVATKD